MELAGHSAKRVALLQEPDYDPDPTWVVASSRHHPLSELLSHMAGADVDSHLRGRPTQRVLSEDVTFTATRGQGHVHLPTFWIDSGAGPTIINRHVVNSLGWLTETTEQYLVFANGRRSGPVEKLLDGLTLTFNGEWEVRTRTYVNEARDYDGLLGNRAGHALSLFVVPITQRAYLLPRLAEGDTSTVASVRVATHVPRFDEPMGVVYADTPITRTDCSLYFCALGQLDLQLDGKLEALGSVHHPVSRAERESTATEYAPIKRENSVCTVLRASTRPFASPAGRGAAVHPSNPLASTMPSNSQPDGVTTHSAVAVQGADVDSLPELEPYSSDSEDDYALQSTTVRWAARYSMLPPPDPEHGGYGCRRPTQTTSATATIATTSGAAESLDSEPPASPTGSLRPCSPSPPAGTTLLRTSSPQLVNYADDCGAFLFNPPTPASLHSLFSKLASTCRSQHAAPNPALPLGCTASKDKGPSR